MLISARANFKTLEWNLLLVEVPAWSRKCSVCLAVMNERWKEDLLSDLESHLEILADETFKIISAGLEAQRAMNDNRQGTMDNETVNVDDPTVRASQPVGLNTTGSSDPFVSDLFGNNATMEWEPLNVFSEFLGPDFLDTYWDIQGMDAAFASNYGTMNSEEEHEGVLGTKYTF